MLFFVGFAMFGVVLYTPLFAQGVLGQSATGSGAVLTPLVLAMTATSIVGGQLVARIGKIRPLMIGGMALVVVGAALLATLSATTSMWVLSASLILIGLGLGVAMPVATVAVQLTVAPRDLGVATSATQFIRSIGSTVGTAVIGSLVTAGYTSRLATAVPQDTPAELRAALADPDVLIGDEAQQQLNELATQIGASADLIEPLIAAARNALAGAIQNGMLGIFVVALLALGIAALLPRLHVKAETAAQPADNRAAVAAD